MEKRKNTPELRFPGFDGEWKDKSFGSLFSFRTTNSFSRGQLNYEEGNVKNVHYGDIHTKFNTLFDIASEEVPFVYKGISLHRISDENYCKEGDIIFADASEDLNDVGKSIEVVNLDNQKLLSGLHTILARPDGNIFQVGFVGYLMKSIYVRTQIQKEAQGTKVLSISGNRLSKITIPFPSISEQQKIATFFTAIDQKISQLKKKKDLLEQYKKGVMQQIFSQQIRFKDDDGREFPKWEKKRLGELLRVSKTKNLDGHYSKVDVLSVSGEHGIVNQIEFQGRSFAGESVHNYGVVETGDIVYTKSPLKTNPYGIIKVNKGKTGIVSTLYAVYKCTNICSGEYLDYYFQLHDNTNGYLRPLVHKGAKNDMKISAERVLIDRINAPSLSEQTKIANFLTAIDNKIQYTQRQIEQAEQWKKGLMQRMFV